MASQFLICVPLGAIFTFYTNLGLAGLQIANLVSAIFMSITGFLVNNRIDIHKISKEAMDKEIEERKATSQNLDYHSQDNTVVSKLPNIIGNQDNEALLSDDMT